MNQVLRPSNQTQAWLSEFLLSRAVIGRPKGEPLYSYQVTFKEYEALRKLLIDNKQDYSSSVKGASWAACFCLFVAETYRREYDASEGGWSWKPSEKKISCDFNPSQRKLLVEKGLVKYWKRPIRQRERGNDLLGTLFAEGGLPWRLVQSDTHGFGRAIKGGLKQFSQGRTTTDIIGDYESSLPQVFRNLDTRQLLAGIVEQLMFLVQNYPLKDQDDPAEYLDQHFKHWRREFPIPLSEENGKRLINEWLKHAVQRRSERQTEVQKDIEFTCSHILTQDLASWKIQTQLFLPKTYSFEVNKEELTSTRFELGFYEGDTLVAKGGVIYGNLTDNVMTVRFPKSVINLQRKNISETVSLRLLENGCQKYIRLFDSSDLHYSEDPMVFGKDDDEWLFVANASCRISAKVARIRMPEGFSLIEGEASVVLKEESGAQWLEAMSDVTIARSGDKYSFSLAKVISKQPYLCGSVVYYQSLPTILYRGWPRLNIPDECDINLKGLVHYVNGKPLSELSNEESVGIIRYTVKNSDGSTILIRRFGLLPKEFEISLFPQSTYNPARVVISSSSLFSVTINDERLRIQTSIDNEKTIISLENRNSEIPSELTLWIKGQSDNKPIKLNFPYPNEGARLVTRDGKSLEKISFSLSELIGTRLVLTSSGRGVQEFFVQIELMNGTHSRPKRQYVISVDKVPLAVSLFAYLEDIVHMLGAIPNQDCFIRFSIDSRRPLLQFDISRYNGRGKLEGNRLFMVTKSHNNQKFAESTVAAMLLSDPKREPIVLEEKLTQGVGTGLFEINQAMKRTGPWLIYPETGSACQFRPELFVPSCTQVHKDSQNIHSLHQATQAFHPIYAPDVIDQQINDMASDFDHSGWQYIADLKMNYGHLPLSTFESWKSLANSPVCLATLVFRLEIDESFCSRLRDELAVIWEFVPLTIWVSVFKQYLVWLKAKSLPESLIDNVVSNRKEVLPAVVSGFEYLDDYLVSGDLSQLKVAPIELFLSDWGHELRNRHPDNSKWPDVIGPVLHRWIQNQSLPECIEALSTMHETNAVTYLPVYMAFVSSGKCVITDLGVELPLLKFAIRMLSDFDRQSWYLPMHSMMVSYLLAKK